MHWYYDAADATELFTFYLEFGISDLGEIMPFSHDGVESLALGCSMSGYSITYNISDVQHFSSAFYQGCDGGIQLIYCLSVILTTTMEMMWRLM